MIRQMNDLPNLTGQSLFIYRLWRQNPVSKALRWLGKRMPKGLYARSLLIIIVPIVALQTIVAYIFMERHWQTVTQRLSTAVTGDIAAIIDMIETYPSDNNYEDVVRIARERLALNVAVLPPDPFPPAAPKPFFSILDDILRDEITTQIGRPFWIDTVGNSDLLEIRIRLEEPENVLRVFARRNQAYASNSHIFLLWMVGASFVLVAISILFLRNQIRPIQQLAHAAELYGKGREVPINLHIRGAREVRQAGLAFLEMRERIDRQIQQRTAMLTGVSHDLRTILTRFRLQVALAGDTPETEELQRDIDEMQRMLQGYMDFAKGESGEEIETVRIADLFERHRNEAKLKERSYTVSCPKDLNIRGRPNALSRLVGNLITNAFRHGNKVKVKVEDDGQDIVMMIDDDGPGIRPSKREEVFKPFIRLDEARNQDEAGTGLGLSIARDIARLHGGDIKLAESRSGGLRAIIRLPH